MDIPILFQKIYYAPGRITLGIDWKIRGETAEPVKAQVFLSSGTWPILFQPPDKLPDKEGVELIGWRYPISNDLLRKWFGLQHLPADAISIRNIRKREDGVFQVQEYLATCSFSLLPPSLAYFKSALLSHSEGAASFLQGEEPSSSSSGKGPPFLYPHIQLLAERTTLINPKKEMTVFLDGKRLDFDGDRCFQGIHSYYGQSVSVPEPHREPTFKAV